ncbi:MAG: ribosome silencing factor [Deltaproteobacteria bacterium]|nr:ribosome silencing factor [Deltaproteobacteria bacterium]
MTDERGGAFSGGDDKISLIRRFLEEKKAEDLVILDLKGLSSVTDTLVIAGGSSDRQVQAISEHLAQEMKNEGYRSLGGEGLQSGRWALLDYGDVIVHVFYNELRRHYDLEGLWRDAPVIVDQRREGARP